MNRILARVRVPVGLNVGELGLSVGVVCVTVGLNAGESGLSVGGAGVNSGEGMLVLNCSLWPCIIGVCRCSGDSLLCIVGGGEGVGVGAGSHHSSDVGVVVGDGVGIGAGSHQSSDVGVGGLGVVGYDLIGEMGLGSCVFMNKGFLDLMGMGDRGVCGSCIG